MCTTTDLTPGAIVQNAELRISGAGAVWDEVELCRISVSAVVHSPDPLRLLDRSAPTRRAAAPRGRRSRFYRSSAITAAARAAPSVATGR